MKWAALTKPITLTGLFIDLILGRILTASEIGYMSKP
jgi:hypothetical protein